MAQYTEIATGVVVDVRALPPFQNHTVVAEVLYPDGRRHGLPYSDVETHFCIVTPQVIQLSGAGTLSAGGNV